MKDVEHRAIIIMKSLWRIYFVIRRIFCSYVKYAKNPLERKRLNEELNMVYKERKNNRKDKR